MFRFIIKIDIGMFQVSKKCLPLKTNSGDSTKQNPLQKLKTDNIYNDDSISKIADRRKELQRSSTMSSGISSGSQRSSK